MALLTTNNNKSNSQQRKNDNASTTGIFHPFDGSALCPAVEDNRQKHIVGSLVVTEAATNELCYKILTNSDLDTYRIGSWFK